MYFSSPSGDFETASAKKHAPRFSGCRPSGFMGASHPNRALPDPNMAKIFCAMFAVLGHSLKSHPGMISWDLKSRPSGEGLDPYNSLKMPRFLQLFSMARIEWPSTSFALCKKRRKISRLSLFFRAAAAVWASACREQGRARRLRGFWCPKRGVSPRLATPRFAWPLPVANIVFGLILLCCLSFLSLASGFCFHCFQRPVYFSLFSLLVVLYDFLQRFLFHFFL